MTAYSTYTAHGGPSKPILVLVIDGVQTIIPKADALDFAEFIQKTFS